MMRTHTCGELTKKEKGKKVVLCGWADTVRSYGKLNFIDLRDRYGKTQIVIKGKCELKPEYVIKVEGEVKTRKPGSENKDLKTGEIEILADSAVVLNASPVLPFEIGDEKVSEEVRAKSRYLDLRGEKMQRNLILRSEVYKAIMDYLVDREFIYVDTPMLGKATPEGARDYIVPSRVNKGEFYALPQSPQLFKQLLMVSGFDKYFQLARCFRDEDLRADRQPEFMQLDIERSFVDVEDMITEMEGLWKYVFDKVLGIKLKTPFKRITYEESMKKYKSDSPDLRKDKKDKKELAFCWVTDFPMFEYSDEDKRWYAMHHPFTNPVKGSDFKSPGKMNAKAYDLVLNGSEMGGGSIRIHDSETQEKVFDLLGIGKKEAEEKFGFLLDALKHGAPPHGGIAFGLDRIVQMMVGADSIRDVIAFPKNKDARDVMLDAPSAIKAEQLKEANIKLDVKKK